MPTRKIYAKTHNITPTSKIYVNIDLSKGFGFGYLEGFGFGKFSDQL